MADKERIAAPASPGKLPADDVSSSVADRHTSAVLVADDEPRSHSLDDLAHPANESRRVRSLLNLQQNYGNYYVEKAVADYRARAASATAKPATIARPGSGAAAPAPGAAATSTVASPKATVPSGTAPADTSPAAVPATPGAQAPQPGK